MPPKKKGKDDKKKGGKEGELTPEYVVIQRNLRECKPKASDSQCGSYVLTGTN